MQHHGFAAGQKRLNRRIKVFNRQFRRIPLEGSHVARPEIHQIEATNQGVYWVISLINTGEFMGTISFWNYDLTENSAHLGYELLPKFHRKGFMSEAVSAVLAHGFHKMGWSKIIAMPEPENTGSIGLLEKSGFRLTGKTEECMVELVLENRDFGK